MFRWRHDGPAIVAVIAISWLAAIGLPGKSIAGKPKGTVIRDLPYGEVLFHYFQQDEFTALTRLLVARQMGQVTHHAAESELLLGGLYLAYGQHQLAGEIFDRLLIEIDDPAVRSRVWFYLGKVRYQRGWFVEAERAFRSVDGELPEYLDAEHHMLLAQSLMGQGRFSEAAEVLHAWDGPADWMAYARYNLGVALVRLERIGDGAKLLARVGELATDDPELMALRDQANLALGYAYLQSGRGGPAKAVLAKVRLHGPFSSKALLGSGWADALHEDYRSALNPWLELQGRDLLDSAVQESLLAVPFAFSQLNAEGSAAEYYLSALNHYDEEIVRLNGAIERAGNGRLIPALLEQEKTTIGRWHWQLESLPETEDARYLYHLVADNRFQDGLRNYRDLMALRLHLTQWRQKLDAFHDMVETGALAYAQRLPVVDKSLAQIDLAQMRARRDTLAAEVGRIESTRDAVALADDHQAMLWRELETMQSSSAWNSPRAAAARSKHRILSGVLRWDLERDYKYRLWQQQRSLAELDAALAEAEDRFDRVEVARRTQPQRLDEFARRIDNLSPRIDALQEKINNELAMQSLQLQALAADELQIQKERLTTYRLQARFALATIYDQSTVAVADPAGAPE